MKRKELIGIVFMLCMSCGTDRQSLTGRWVQPIPGQQGVQGMLLEKDGKASSVNMSTLVFRSWKQEDNALILGGESVGNGQTLVFSDTLRVERLTADSLVLSKGNWTTVYTRED